MLTFLTTHTYTRCDPKIIVILNFFKNYLFICLLVLFKVTPLRCKILMPPFFFQSSKHFWNALSGIANNHCFDFSFISSIIAKRFSVFGVFSFGKKKYSAEAKSGEYCGWGIMTVLLSANCFVQSSHNFKVVFLIARTMLWHGWMHDAPCHCNRRKLWAKPSHLIELDVLFFRSWLFGTLSLLWLSFCFNIIAIHSWFASSYDLFEQRSSLNVVNI